MAHHPKKKKNRHSRHSRKSRGVAKSTVKALRKSVSKTNSLLKKVVRQSRKGR